MKTKSEIIDQFKRIIEKSDADSINKVSTELSKIQFSEMSKIELKTGFTIHESYSLSITGKITDASIDNTKPLELIHITKEIFNHAENDISEVLLPALKEIADHKEKNVFTFIPVMNVEGYTMFHFSLNSANDKPDSKECNDMYKKINKV